MSSTSDTYAYNDTTYGINSSTTGNVYGIYDMSGGRFEFVAAYVNNGNSSLTTYGRALLDAPTYMKDVYEGGSSNTRQLNYEECVGKYGDAIYETSVSGNNDTSWYQDRSSFCGENAVFLTRGGEFGGTTRTGIFGFASDIGNLEGFRPTLITQ